MRKKELRLRMHWDGNGWAASVEGASVLHDEYQGEWFCPSGLRRVLGNLVPPECRGSRMVVTIQPHGQGEWLFSKYGAVRHESKHPSVWLDYGQQMMILEGLGRKLKEGAFYPTRGFRADIWVEREDW